MTLAKLLRVLKALSERNAALHSGSIGTNSGGEVTFYFNGQLDRSQHDYLLSVGFIWDPNADGYAYRPIIRKRR